jgi:hypothetical protein
LHLQSRSCILLTLLPILGNAACLQVRGSIPLLWSQIPNIKYKPTTRLLASGSPTSAAFDAHFDGLLAKYKVSSARTTGTSGGALVLVLHDNAAMVLYVDTASVCGRLDEACSHGMATTAML